MNKYLKTSFVSIVAFFLFSCGDPEQKELANALLNNGVNPGTVYHEVDQKQAFCIVKNIKELSNKSQWEHFKWEELEMPEMTDSDIIRKAWSYGSKIGEGGLLEGLFDGWKAMELSTAVDEITWQAIQKCDRALWVRMKEAEKPEAEEIYSDSDTAETFTRSDMWIRKKNAAEGSEQLEEAVSVGKEFIQVIIKTSEGEIKLELNNKKAPITVENFLSIANSGYYEGTIFHRVSKNVIEGGLLNSDMSKKPSGTAPIQNEANNGLSNDRGTIAMARTMDPHSATSQFFINHKDNGFLNHTAENSDGWGYAVFGVVTEGMDIVDQIADVITSSYKGYADVPAYDITIESIKIIE